jgi:sigma-B regulation protein RsbU (phosphoserine phosphatase)
MKLSVKSRILIALLTVALITTVAVSLAAHLLREVLPLFLLVTTLVFAVVILLSVRFAKAFSRPVEDLARANAQLKAQSAAMQSAANGIVISDIHGLVQWVNPAFTRLTGYEPSEITGRGLRILNSGTHSKEFFRGMWKAILAGQVWHDEIVNRRRDGTLYTEEMTITPVYGDDGKIAQFVAIKHDISERKRLEQIVMRANERMEGELNVARDIQASMLPLKFPAFPDRQDIDVFARLIPAREVGGDFYDFFFTDEENFCFVIGDVSGKGVPAALFMAVTKVLIKASASTERSTARILTKVNDEISRDNPNNMFITVFIGLLNTTTGYMVYTNAGHNPPYLMRRNGGPIDKLSNQHAAVIGAFEGVVYRETVIQLQRGDSILTYTDGVTEAQDHLGRLFTDDRLLSLVSESGFKGCQQLVDLVSDKVIEYEAGTEQADDITLMSVSFCEQTEGSVIDYLFTNITNRLENISGIIDRFGQFAAGHGIPSEIVQKIDIVFDELLTNTISYAYQDKLEHEIEIKIRYYQKQIIVTIMDDGTPFNPFDRSDPDTSLGMDDREIGGLGVHLVKLLVDDYHYEYKQQISKNITSFKKHI